MFGSDEVDVVTSQVLKLQHHLRQPGGSDLLSPHLPGDVVVLAEHAPQVAAGEEDGPGPLPAAEAVLLSEVRKVGADYRPSPDRAQPSVVGQPVDLAQARTDRASISAELPDGLRGPRRDLPNSQRQVRGGRIGDQKPSLSRHRQTLYSRVARLIGGECRYGATAGRASC
jgi:hypothetical protein